MNIINIDKEANIPTWFSSVQLFVIGFLFFLLFHNRNIAPEMPEKLLGIISLGFIFLSLDEAAQIHEGISKAFKHISWMPYLKNIHNLWILPYISLIFIFLLGFHKDLWKFAQNYRQSFLFMAIGFFIFILGGLFFEILSYQFLIGTARDLLYDCEVTMEEFLEMSGASLILYGTLLLFLPDNNELP